MASICWGTTISYASFSPPKKPIIKETFLIIFSSTIIGFTSGFAVFSVIGYLIYMGSPVSDKVQSIGLAFIAYPAAIDMMKGANLWAFVFGLTVFFLGIDSAFSLLEAGLTSIQESSVGKLMAREKLSLLWCILGVLVSILFCFNWGYTLFDVIDHYLNIYLLLSIGLWECFAVAWVNGYGQAVN